MRILIVEDEPDGADLVARILSAAGFETMHTDTAEAALEQLNNYPDFFDAVVIDLALPEMDGMELMQCIHESPQIDRLPLIAITAYHTPELKVKVMDAGFDAYFSKPLDTTIFSGALLRLLDANAH